MMGYSNDKNGIGTYKEDKNRSVTFYFINHIHKKFSHHSKHHKFPALNPYYYELFSYAFQLAHPENHLIPMHTKI